MLIDREDYVMIVDSLNGGWNEHPAGQWVYYDSIDRIRQLVPKVESLVLEYKILAASYTTKDPKYDPYPEVTDSRLSIFCKRYRDSELKFLLENELDIVFAKWTDHSDALIEWQKARDIRRKKGLIPLPSRFKKLISNIGILIKGWWPRRF